MATRTEKGVHAPGNALTFTVTAKSEESAKQIEPKTVMGGVNYCLSNLKLTIILSSCQDVPVEFDVRNHAVAREFIYRVALPKKDVDLRNGPESQFPVSELYRTAYLTKPEKLSFDIDLASSMTQKLKGGHDFSSFCGNSSVSKMRTIDEFEVNKMDLSTHHEFDENDKNIDIFEYYIRGKSFLNYQIPKMVSALTAVATGLEPPSFINHLMENPSSDKWKDDEYYTMPTHGQYLIGVHYEDQDLGFGKTRVVENLEDDDFDDDLIQSEELEQLKKNEEEELKKSSTTELT